MPIRPLVLATLATLSAAVAAGCGTSTGVAPATARTDARTLLRDTFRRQENMRSARIAATLDVTGPRLDASSLRITGPFQSPKADRLPAFQYAVSAESAGRAVQSGATWTGNQAFVAFQGRQYAVPDLLARQLEAAYEEAERNAGGTGLAPAALGVDPSRWLRSPRNAGARTVGGSPTIRLTGRGDVARVLGDLQRLRRRTRALSPSERRRAVRSVRNMRVEVDTGAKDRILRRLAVRADLRDARSGQRGRLDFVVTFTGVNAKQEIAAPQGARPLDQLLARLRAFKRAGP
jgi:hypothetical protein